MTKRAVAVSAAARLDVATTWGDIRVVADGGKIKACTLPMLRAEPRKPFRWGKSILLADEARDRRVLKEADAFIRAVLEGGDVRTPDFHWPPSTPFMIRVWKALTSIPRGRTVEYGELARSIGRAGGARAVGRACGANPLPLFIPCHRVLPKDGSLGGFSSGLPWKRLLLEKEGCR